MSVCVCVCVLLCVVSCIRLGGLLLLDFGLNCINLPCLVTLMINANIAVCVCVRVRVRDIIRGLSGGAWGCGVERGRSRSWLCSSLPSSSASAHQSRRRSAKWSGERPPVDLGEERERERERAWRLKMSISSNLVRNTYANDTC